MSILNKIWLLGFCCQARAISWQGEKEAAAHKGKVSKVSFQRSRSRSCKFLRLKRLPHCNRFYSDFIILWYHYFQLSTILQCALKISKKIVIAHYQTDLYWFWFNTLYRLSMRLSQIDCGRVWQCNGMSWWLSHSSDSNWGPFWAPTIYSLTLACLLKQRDASFHKFFFKHDHASFHDFLFFSLANLTRKTSGLA